MRRTEVIPAKQGHPVPDRPYNTPRSIFSDEITAPPVLVTDYVPQPDGGGEPVPEGSTAQNGFRAQVQWYRCRDCHVVLHEELLDTHQCPTGNSLEETPS